MRRNRAVIAIAPAAATIATNNTPAIAGFPGIKLAMKGFTPGRNITTSRVMPAIIGKSLPSIMRRYWAKIRPPITIPNNPMLISGDDKRLLKAINSKPPSNPVKAAPAKISIRENLGLGGSGTGAGG